MKITLEQFKNLENEIDIILGQQKWWLESLQPFRKALILHVNNIDYSRVKTIKDLIEQVLEDPKFELIVELDMEAG